MPGLKDSYISGYCDPILLKEGLSAFGELVVEREDDGVGKGYVFLLARTDTEVFYAGPYKPQEGHHFDPSGGIQLDDLFGKITKYPKV